MSNNGHEKTKETSKIKIVNFKKGYRDFTKQGEIVRACDSMRSLIF